MQRIHIGPAVGRQRDHVDALVRCGAQADDIALFAAVSGEIGHAVLLARLDQLPLFGIEGAFGLQVGNGIADITNFSDTAHGR